MPTLPITLVALVVGSLFGPAAVAVVAAAAAVFVWLPEPRDAGSPDGGRLHGRWLGVIFSALFPLAALRWGESSFLIMMAIVVVVSAAFFVAMGLREDAVVGYSHILMGVLTGGFLLSYLPIVRSMESGRELLWSFLLILMATHLVRSYLPRLAPPSQRWIPPVAAASAAVLVAIACLLFLPDDFAVLTMLILGLAVGGAALLGEQLERMLGEDRTGARALWRGLGPLLVAGPAFFYTFRLYLT